jgi:hypothetical protein
MMKNAFQIFDLGLPETYKGPLHRLTLNFGILRQATPNYGDFVQLLRIVTGPALHQFALDCTSLHYFAPISVL